MLENVHIENYKVINSSGSAVDLDVVVELCLKENVVGQQKLYRHFYPQMMALVKRYTSDPDQAVDILNNGFLRVFKKLHTFREEGSLEGWIRRIIMHAVADYFRYKKPATEVFLGEIPEARMDTTVSDGSDYQYLLTLLRRLPETTRLVVNFSIIDGYTYPEISNMTGISESACRWHVANGRKILRKMIGDQKICKNG
jgi:RNA polymerase sigma-70 factor, ECF subfamily